MKIPRAAVTLVMKQMLEIFCVCCVLMQCGKAEYKHEMCFVNLYPRIIKNGNLGLRIRGLEMKRNLTSVSLFKIAVTQESNIMRHG
jgi:hypothetical protein